MNKKPFRASEDEIKLIKFIRNFAINPIELIAVLMEKWREDIKGIAI